MDAASSTKCKPKAKKKKCGPRNTTLQKGQSTREAVGATATNSSPVRGEGRGHVLLESGCTLRDTNQLQLVLGAATAFENRISLDGSAVVRVDTAGLQLLVAFARRHRDAGQAIVWLQASDALRAAAAQLGLEEELSLGSQATGKPP